MESIAGKDAFSMQQSAASLMVSGLRPLDREG
jgi:hypothetical protein